MDASLGATLLHALVITPNRADAELALAFLAESGIAASACAGIEELGAVLPADAGCVVLAAEALADAGLAGLRELLEQQPAWSDLPLVLVAEHGAGPGPLVEHAFPQAGNVTLLERPLNPLTLVSAVRVGLRARARQMQVRNLLEKRDEALRRRDEFLAMLAHELRNPLAPLRNAVYLLKGLRTEDAVILKTRDILDRQVSHLTRLVDDLLDVARLERGKISLRLERLDLNAAVRASLEPFMARDHDVRLQLSEEPLFVEADAVRLDQLVTNLLVNSAKFTPAGGRIEVRAAREGGAAVVSVRDSGIGIRPEMLETVFMPFAQDDRTLARSRGGLGIGLAIARALVELHGGTLRAASEGLNKGAVFELRLPLSARPAPAAAGMAPAQTAEGLRRRVLVVEDNPDIRESLRMVLGQWGHEVMLAETGDEGLALALGRKPDVALIDIGLPGMSGYEVAAAIRAQARERIRLVALTGYGQPADRERAAQAGFDVHLLKPVDASVLSEVLNA